MTEAVLAQSYRVVWLAVHTSQSRMRAGEFAVPIREEAGSGP
jgi:hypothetical protein